MDLSTSTASLLTVKLAFSPDLQLTQTLTSAPVLLWKMTDLTQFGETRPTNIGVMRLISKKIEINYPIFIFSMNQQHQITQSQISIYLNQFQIFQLSIQSFLLIKVTHFLNYLVPISVNKLSWTTLQMKKVSKKTHQQLQKHTFSKPLTFQHSQIVTQGGHFVKPSSHASFAHQKLLIICKGYGDNAQQIANEVLNCLKEPMLTLVNPESLLNKDSQNLLGNELNDQSKQRYMMLNLIDSCFEQLSTKNLEGSCSFGICYITNNTLFIVKNKIIECYLIQKKQRDTYDFKTVGSRKIPFQINSIPGTSNSSQIASKQTSGFLACDRSYENILTSKYFPEVSFLSMKVPKGQNCTLLMGNSQSFCNFQQRELIEYLAEVDDLRKFGEKIIEASKIRWKTIYQEDMTVISTSLG